MNISGWIYDKALHLTKGRLNPEDYGITELLLFASNEIRPGATLLDAGAGDSRDRRYFVHTNYISIDIGEHRYDYLKLDIIGDLKAIPLKANSVDAVLCKQVLEHVDEPKQVLFELFRVLKPSGQLFLTAPQAWPLHGEPYDFFRYTRYGFEHLFKAVGFRIVFIEPIGGFFWFMATILNDAARAGIKNRVLKLPSVILFSIIIPIFLFYLDRFDKEKKMPVGWKCYCRK